jgi:hypothetical protein
MATHCEYEEAGADVSKDRSNRTMTSTALSTFIFVSDRRKRTAVQYLTFILQVVDMRRSLNDGDCDREFWRQTKAALQRFGNCESNPCLPGQCLINRMHGSTGALWERGKQQPLSCWNGQLASKSRQVGVSESCSAV